MLFKNTFLRVNYNLDLVQTNFDLNHDLRVWSNNNKTKFYIDIVIYSHKLFCIQ